MSLSTQFLDLPDELIGHIAPFADVRSTRALLATSGHIRKIVSESNTNLVLDDLNIPRVSNVLQLAALFPRLTRFSLSSGNLRQWFTLESVKELTIACPLIEYLDLSGGVALPNLLQFDGEMPDNLMPILSNFEHLRYLDLSHIPQNLGLGSRLINIADSRAFPHVTYLNVNYYGGFECMAHLPCFPALIELHALTGHGRPCISVEAEKRLGEWCPNLQVLEATLPPFFPTAPIRNLPHLTSLSTYDMENRCPQQLANIWESFPLLKVLWMSSSPRRTTLSPDEARLPLFTACERLQIPLSNDVQIDDLIASFPTLTELSYRGYNVSTSNRQGLDGLWSNMRHLDFSGGVSFTAGEPVLPMLATRCPNLVHLDLSWAVYAENSTVALPGIESIRMLTKLEKLLLAGQLLPYAADFFTPLINLRYLDISAGTNQYWMSDKHIESICAPGLQYLNIAGNEQLTDVTAKKLLTFPQLQILYARSCHFLFFDPSLADALVSRGCEVHHDRDSHTMESNVDYEDVEDGVPNYVPDSPVSGDTWSYESGNDSFCGWDSEAEEEEEDAMES